MLKIAIVGAGIMGRLLAFCLVHEGHQISIFDQDKDEEINSCSMAAAGLLTPVTELDKSEKIIYEMGEAALFQHWPAIVARLQNNIYFQQQGSIAVAHPKDSAEIERFISFISNKLNNHQVYEKLNPKALSELEPSLNKFTHAYYFPREGQIDNQAVLIEIKKYLLAKEVAWYSDTFIEHVQAGEIYYNHSKIQFDLVLDCRGIGAKTFFPDLQGIRGELIWLYAPDVILSRPIRFQHPRYSLYIAPRPNHVYLVGASEILSEDTSGISVRTVLELLTAVYSLHPGFAEAVILKTVTHCRPTLSNALPKIKYTDGLLAVNGLYRHGFLIAPTLATEIIQWLKQGFNSLQFSQLWEGYDKCNV